MPFHVLFRGRKGILVTNGMILESVKNGDLWRVNRFIFNHGLNALEAKEIKSETQLDKEIENGTALIDFSAPWYAPCRLQEPIIRQLVTKFEGKALIATMNIDENSDVALRLGIQSVPTLIIFKNGKEIQRFIGLQSEAALSEALRKLLE